MKLIVAYIPSEALSRVTRELERIHVQGMSVSSVHGFGQENDSLHPDHTDLSEIVKMKKTRLEIGCQDDEVEPILDAVYRIAHTGLRGNGKVFVLPILDALRLKTGERGADALGLHAANGNRAALGLSAPESTRRTTP